LLDRGWLNSTVEHGVDLFPSTDAQQQQQTITIVNRKRTRRLVNSDNITAALQNAYPSALIQTVYMEGMEPIEQFAVFSQAEYSHCTSRSCADEWYVFTSRQCLGSH
jgi:hypothetical protein